MKLLDPVIVAFSLFSRIPTPHLEWKGERMRYALCAFPLVGLVQGVLAVGWGMLADWLALAPVLAAAGLVILPVLVNGGIHLDGLCDTSDALTSHAPPEKKRQILADPHIGAFGVLTLVLHMLLGFALFTQLDLSLRSLCGIACIYPLSRAWSGFAVLRFPAAKTDGTAAYLAKESAGEAWIVLLAAAAAVSACIVLLAGLTGCFSALAALLTLLYYRRMAARQFGGISGDLAGWFLQTAELAMTAVFVIGGSGL